MKLKILFGNYPKKYPFHSEKVIFHFENDVVISNAGAVKEIDLSR